MLTRLKVNGFKNLVDVDLRFGPFTCIAGANGVGKSNLFDAIHLLSALSDRPLLDAAQSVRDEDGKVADVRSLFHRFGTEYASQMSFEVEMIVPQTGTDDLGQTANATNTFLRYSLVIAYRKEESLTSWGAIELIKEELVHINKGDTPKNLLFNYEGDWLASAVKNKIRASPFISTEGEGSSRLIKLHQDKGPGRTRSLLASSLPRTVLSTANAAENPTALIARREMQSWRLLQLEPTALRKPDEFSSPTHISADGAHLAATLYSLAEDKSKATEEMPGDSYPAHIYSQIANRLAALIDDVQAVSVDRDDKRELLTLQVRGRDGTQHPARALSDGTLRFLALVVLEMDPTAQGVLCLEEPENGIHPARIEAMLQLLQGIATDTNLLVGSANPLRQVIINTHSPAVVGVVPDDTLLVAELKETIREEHRFKRVCFGCLPDTWRSKAGDAQIPRGQLLAYLNPFPPMKDDEEHTQETSDHARANGTPPQPKVAKPKRVVDRDDVRQIVFPFGGR